MGMFGRFPMRQLARKIGWRLYMWGENIGDADMATNGEAWLIRSLPAPVGRFVFFDVGANVGKYTSAVLARFPDAEGHLFDPQPACAATLREAFAPHEGIRVNEAACSDEAGRRSMWLDAPQDSMASLHRHSGHGASELEIETIVLERYIEELGVGHIHLLKVDVEGHELEALTGMGGYLGPSFVDLIQFEYAGIGADSPTSLRSLWQLLEARGFVLCKLMPRGLWRRVYYPAMDNFQYANYVAVSPAVIGRL